MYYSGTAGSGYSLLVLKDGFICGADVVGGLIDGSYVNSGDGTVDFTVLLRAPAGTSLVTGVIVGREPVTQQIKVSLPVDFSNGSTHCIQTPTGPINAVFKWLRDCK